MKPPSFPANRAHAADIPGRFACGLRSEPALLTLPRLARHSFSCSLLWLGASFAAQAANTL